MTPVDRGPADDESPHVLFDIQGMHCASCAANVERILSGVAGVRGARVNLLTNQASVQFDSRQTSAPALIDAVARGGYSASLAPDRTANSATGTWWDRQQQEGLRWRRRLIVAIALLLPLVWITHGSRFVPGGVQWWWALALATPLEFYVGWPYLAGAFGRLRHGSANMDTLVAMGTGTAYLAGLVSTLSSTLYPLGLSHGGHAAGDMYLADAGMILTFITLGKYLEAKTKGRASQAIRKLLDLAPPEALVVRDAATLRLPVQAVMVGEIILVRPGEKVPLDAEVVSGTSSVDQAWLTGEPIPVDKQAGDEILAGTINGMGSLTAHVVRPAGQTTLAQVIELVRRAQESKTDVGRLADAVVGWFVPAVLAIAAIAFAAWGLAAGDWNAALSSAVAVLVVACPCALGLATPTAVLVGSGRGAQSGILIKEARALEIAGRLTTVVLDKTGTVTLGHPAVTEIVPAGTVGPDRLLAAAAAAERLSPHPLAAAVVTAAETRNIPIAAADSLEVVPGMGIHAHRNGETILVGNPQLLQAAGIDCSAASEAVASARRNGQTPLLVAQAGEFLGWIAVNDPIASTSRDAVAQFHAMGLEVHLLSGDNRITAEAVAAAVGIDHVTAEVLPEEKQRVVRELQQSGKVVAMVGDGINDAPALAAADLGIAIGSGSDVAIEAADVVLMGNDLRQVAQAIALSRATLRTIRQNLLWALIYNVALLPLAAGVFVPWIGIRLPPAAAAAAMAASSVSVVTNSLLLARRKLVL
jgi:Cu+-exporting ATPase